MELSIPPSVALEHRGSYSSAKSTLAAGIWTPPHSPTLGDMYIDTEEELTTPTTTTSTRPEDKMHQEQGAQQEKEFEAVNVIDTTPEVVAEPEQPAELRLSDFQVVDTLGEPFSELPPLLT